MQGLVINCEQSLKSLKEAVAKQGLVVKVSAQCRPKTNLQAGYK